MTPKLEQGSVSKMILDMAGLPSVWYNVTHRTSLVSGQCSTFTQLYHQARRQGTDARLEGTASWKRQKVFSLVLFTRKEPCLQFEKWVLVPSGTPRGRQSSRSLSEFIGIAEFSQDRFLKVFYVDCHQLYHEILHQPSTLVALT